MSATRTFCFTDIESSTRLLTRLGNDVYESVQDIQRAVLREAWSTHGGTEVRSEGDGSFVVFDAPECAIAACLQAQLMLKEAEWPANVEVRVRMGMHTREANPTADGDFVGLAVHHAARVGSAANGGQVLVTETTAAAAAAAALPDFSALTDLGSFRLRDVEEPLRLYAVEHPDLARDPRPPRAPSSAVHNLPIVRTAFIGRGDELREVTKLIAGQPMVTILGTGGVGKTRLALEAASASIGVFADGAWLVELAAVDDPALVAPRVASALGLEDDPSRPSIDVIVDHLRDRHLLLVLDNCEHLLDPVAELVEAALRSSEGSTVLATSREPLRIRGETTWRLPPFSESEAAELFTDRARIADGSFVLDGSTAGTVAHICNRLDGIALALELAASRLRSMSLTELASSLDNRFTTLVGGYRTDLPRQKTLRAAIDWSYELLNAEEQTLFASLSVFRGGATLDAISAVCGSVVAQLGVLVERSLVDPADERYTMLETIHAYASERLDESGRAGDVREAHRDHFSQPTSIDRLYAEQDNIRAALSFRTDEKMLVLASAASPIWHRYGPYREGYRWLTEALHANPEPSEARADALGALITLLPSMGLFDECAAAFVEILGWHRSTNNDAAVASALYGRAELALTRGDLAGAKMDLDAALSHHVDDGGEHEGRCNFALAHIALVELRLNDARALASSAVAGFRNVKGVNLEAAAVMMLGRVEQAAFRFEDAERHFEEALPLHRRIGDRSNIAYTGVAFRFAPDRDGRTVPWDRDSPRVVRTLRRDRRHERTGRARLPRERAVPQRQARRRTSHARGRHRAHGVAAPSLRDPLRLRLPRGHRPDRRRTRPRISRRIARRRRVLRDRGCGRTVRRAATGCRGQHPAREPRPRGATVRLRRGNDREPVVPRASRGTASRADGRHHARRARPRLVRNGTRRGVYLDARSSGRARFAVRKPLTC